MTSGAEGKRRHAAGQRNIVRYCICGRAIVGNAGWWSHMNAHPDDSWNHRRITSVEVATMERGQRVHPFVNPTARITRAFHASKQ